MRIAYVPPALPTEKFAFLKHLQKIPHKYFASGIFILFAFTSQLNVLDLLCGIFISFAEIKIEKTLQNKKIFDKIVNEQLLLEIEEKVFKYVSSQQNFVRVEEIIRGQEEGDYQVFDNDTVVQETSNQSSELSDYMALPKVKEIQGETEQNKITNETEVQQVN